MSTADRSTFAPVTIPDSEVRQLKSLATGHSYDIYVHFPDGYMQNQEKKYPVLYVLDGQWDFKLLDSLCGGLIFDEFMPQVIIAGITYSGNAPDYGALRAIDFTTVHDPEFPDSGGASRFFAFLKEELSPFLESNYRVEPSQRVLLGSSFGGIFTLYAMFAEPGFFNGYIATSPPVEYGDRFAYKQENEYASSHADLPVRLFLSVGELEEIVGTVMEFMEVIRDRGYTSLKLETRTIEGERHAGNKAEAYNRGLRFVFQDK